MKYCASCGTALDDAALFCTDCGAQQTPAAQIIPVAKTPTPDTPPTSAKVMSGIGFGLSLFSLFMGCTLVLVTCVGLGIAENQFAINNIARGVIQFFLFGAISYPLASTILCSKARKNGVGGIAIAGTVFGIISIVLFCLSLLIAVVNLI